MSEGAIYAAAVAAGTVLAMIVIERLWFWIAPNKDEGPLDWLRNQIFDKGPPPPVLDKIRVDCPKCSKAYAVPLELAGKKASCGNCG